MCTSSANCANDPAYLSCVNEVQRDLITTTAAVSALASFLMGLLANLPVGLAPGLGLNAYVRALLITYRSTRILSFHGRFSSHIPW